VFPESLRWLVAQGRLEVAHGILVKYAEKSSVVVDSDTLTSMLKGCQAVETRTSSTQIQRSPLDLVRTPRMRKRTVILCYNWYADYFCKLSTFVKKLDQWIMQFERFHWLSYHWLWFIISCSTNMVRVRVIFFWGGGRGRFDLYFSLVFYILGPFLVKTRACWIWDGK